MIKKIRKEQSLFERYFREADEDDKVSVKVAPRQNRGTDYSDDSTTVKVAPRTNRGTDYNAEDEQATEPDTGDGGGEDYTDDSQSGNTDEDADTSDDNQTDDSESNEDDADKKRKYSMYLRYIRLYELISTFSEYIRSIVKDDFTQNAVIKTVVNNLNDLYDGMYDYMIIKYKTASYVEVLLYYETVINCIRLNFELLRNNKINLKQ